MRLALAPKVAVVEEVSAAAEEDKVVAEEDKVAAKEGKVAAEEDQRVAVASNHRHSTRPLKNAPFCPISADG